MESDNQDCQVCHKKPDANNPFNCHRCARHTIYEPRLELARTLLAKECLGKEIENHVKSSQNDQRTTLEDGAPQPSNTLALNAARSEYRLIAARTQTILDDSRRLQENIESMREELAQMKATIAKRKRAVKASDQETRYEEDTSVKKLNESISAVKPAWDKLHSKIVSGRHVLTRELSSLYGLHIRKRRKSSNARDSFMIAGIPVFNLKELNNASPEHLNTSTYHVAHLIHLASHYLGLRLPAEISLATAGQPITHLHPPMSSYKAVTLNFGSRDSNSNKAAPRKRVLWLEKPLSQLASEDPQAYSLYLDAIILLAWDVAWVAKSQGIDVGGKGWEDICLVGKNLWDLFGDSAAMRTEHQPRQGSDDKDQGAIDLASTSQASAHSFLNSGGRNGAAELVRTWKYATPTRIIETIKSALMNERMGADWEVLERPEEEEAFEAGNNQALPQDSKNTTVSMAFHGKNQVLSPSLGPS